MTNEPGAVRKARPSPQAWGRVGEKAAVSFLRRKRFRVVETGYRFQRGEIDIIAYDGPVLVFVEVKARQGRGYGFPEEAVTAAKRRQLRKIALAYLVRHGIRGVPCRFDVIAVDGADPDRPALRHIVNAF
jgi:putative endonuclease